MAIKPRICKECGQKFVPEQENYHYCKWECRQAAQKKQSNDKKSGKVRGEGNDNRPRSKKVKQAKYGPPNSSYGPPQNKTESNQQPDLQRGDLPRTIKSTMVGVPSTNKELLLKFQNLTKRIGKLESKMETLEKQLDNFTNCGCNKMVLDKQHGNEFEVELNLEELPRLKPNVVINDRDQNEDDEPPF